MKEKNSNVVIKHYFYPPGHEKRSYYQSAEGYLRYMKDKQTNADDSYKENGFINYFDYMQNRKGSSGFWTNNENDKVIPIGDDVMVWDIVVSFKESFAAKHSIIAEEQTKDIIQKTIDNWMKNNKLDPDKMQYVVSHHSNTDNPHCHIRLNEIAPAMIGKDGKYYSHNGKLKISAAEAWKADIENNLENGRIIDWSVVSAKKKYARQLIQEDIKNSWIELGGTVGDIQKLIKNKTNNKRISFESFNPTDKETIAAAFDSYMSLKPKIKKTWLEMDQWYEDKSFGETKVDTIFEQRKKAALKSLINVFVKTIADLPSFSPSTSNIKQRKYSRVNRNRTYKRWNNKNTKTFLDAFDVDFEKEVKQIEREIAAMGREFTNGRN